MLCDESDPRLPPGFQLLDKFFSSQRLAPTPSRDAFIAALRAAGFAASRSSVDSRAFKTSATPREAADVAIAAFGLTSRAAPQAPP